MEEVCTPTVTTRVNCDNTGTPDTGYITDGHGGVMYPACYYISVLGKSDINICMPYPMAPTVMLWLILRAIPSSPTDRLKVIHNY